MLTGLERNLEDLSNDDKIKIYNVFTNTHYTIKELAYMFNTSILTIREVISLYEQEE